MLIFKETLIQYIPRQSKNGKIETKEKIGGGENETDNTPYIFILSQDMRLFNSFQPKEQWGIPSKSGSTRRPEIIIKSLEK